MAQCRATAFADRPNRRYILAMAGPRPLLIFDSGVGGLSVLKAIRGRLPGAAIVYAADKAGYPYGTKNPAVIEARVPALLGRLSERFDGKELPFLLIRQNDWVNSIALDAQSAVAERINDAYATRFARCLRLILHLASYQRRDLRA